MSQMTFVAPKPETPKILKAASTRERQTEYGPETLIDAEIISVIMDVPTTTAEKVIELGSDLKALGSISESRAFGNKRRYAEESRATHQRDRVCQTLSTVSRRASQNHISFGRCRLAYV